MRQIRHSEILKQTAVDAGASAAAVIKSATIEVRDELARLCNGEYVCPNYGLAASCPPHVGGPEKFRQWQAESEYAVVVKIDVPTSVMFSDQRNEVMHLLHHVVSGVEHEAIKMGLENSKAFAGGSCKGLFCADAKACCVVAENKPCCHEAHARPSMSGFGIDVSVLLKSAGWSGEKAEQSGVADSEKMTWVAGLVLLA